MSLKYYKHTNNHALCRTIFEGAILTIIHFVFIYSIKVFLEIFMKEQTNVLVCNIVDFTAKIEIFMKEQIKVM